ncbi:MAG: S9 family peptidase, partial [Janthinobacterium sp.]
MIRYALPVLLFASVLPAHAQAPVNETPLIERAKIFGNPSKSGGRISPDGKWLSWIAPRDGVLNVWVAPSSDLAQARSLTEEKVRPIRSSFWSPDSTTLLYIQDKGGDENFLLYGVNVATGKQINYTPFEKTRVRVIQISSKVKDRILIGINNRDARWHDVYSLDLASGKLTLVQQNDGYGGYLADELLNLRIASKARTDGGMQYFRITDGKVDSAPLAEVGLEDSQTTAPLAFTADGKTTVVAQDPRADIADALYDTRTGRVQAYSVDYLQQEYLPLTDELKADLAFLKKHAKGQFNVTSRTEADDKWLVGVDAVTAPASSWLYERKTKKLTQLYVTRPELEGAPLVPMYPQEIKARDGLTLVSYLTLPHASKASAGGVPSRAVPMVLLVHGGPWARDTYGYNGYHQ